jgi:hypothetical protein
MRKTLETTLAVVAVVMLFGTGVIVGRRSHHPSSAAPDTVRVCHIETLVVERPVERLRTIVRHDTVWLATDNSAINNKVWSADTLPLHDSVRTIVPIQRIHYTDDSTFVAVVSGYRTRLDSLVLLRRESHTTVRTSRPSPPRIVISAGPQAGIYRTPVGWHTGIGFGIGIGITIAPRRDNK